MTMTPWRIASQARPLLVALALGLFATSVFSLSWKVALAFIPYQLWIGIATALNYEYGRINITQ